MLIDRAVYERRRRRIESARAVPPGRPLPPGLSTRALEEILSAGETPQGMVESIARHLISRRGPEHYARRAASSRSRWKRVTALRVLGAARAPGAYDLLERALRDPDPEIVAAAVQILGGMGERTAGGLLVDALVQNLYPRSRIATLLESFPASLGDRLLPHLRSSEPIVRFWAANLLARHREVPGLEGELAQLASDPEPLVRKSAVESLGILGGPQAVSVAERLLEDPVWYVRAHAARAAAELGQVQLAPRIADLLGDANWWTRAAAKEALVALPGVAASAAIARLEHPDRFARNGAAEVLQNLGWIDRVLEDLFAGQLDPAGRATLRKVLAAGEAGLVASLAARAGAVREAELAAVFAGAEERGG